MSLSPINKRINYIQFADEFLSQYADPKEINLISVIVPVCNEEKNIPDLYRKLVKQFDKNDSYAWELIFVNDGSTDKSDRMIKKLVVKDDRVKYLELSRNFGKEIAVTAGLNHARGQAAIIMDSDLQHPPQLIPQFIKKWRQGNDLVIGIRKKYTQSIFKRVTSRAFYYVIGRLSNTPIRPHATDFRLIDRKVIEEFNRFTERNRITRGLLDWMGYKTEYVRFTPAPRQDGQPSYSFQKLWTLATNTIVAHSIVPLKIAGYLGGIITVFSIFVGLFMFLSTYVFYDQIQLYFSGTAMLAVLNVFLAGITLSTLGLISLYIAHIQNEVTNRPLYLVRNKYNFKNDHLET